MNCKPGDWARVVRSDYANYGKIVRCVRFVADFQYADPKRGVWRADSWVIDPPLPSLNGLLVEVAPDAWLRPLRPDAAPGSITRDTPTPERVL